MFDRPSTAALIAWVFLSLSVAIGGTSCTAALEANCKEDAQCEAGQYCLKSGGIFVRDGVCVDEDPQSGIDTGVEPDAGDVGVGDTGGIEDADPADADDPADRDADNGDIDSPCPSGEIECNEQCVDPSSDLLHCGECDNECHAGDHASAICVAGSCDFECNEPFEACGQQCVDFNSNPDHCGDCDVPCSDEMVCSAGLCQADCADGETVCEGACVDITSNPAYCGDCDTICPAPNDGVGVCVNGGCDFECNTGFTACAEECVPEDSAFEECDDQCVDTSVDDDHCGQCNNDCGTGEGCDDGICCDGEFTNCGGQCIDLVSDDDHCGVCENQCTTGVAGATAFCSQSSCVEQCTDTSHTLCDGDERCADLDTDIEHCGSCEVSCDNAPENGTPICEDGACSFQCNTNFEECGGECWPTDDFDDDIDNCGECGNVCDDAPAASTQVCEDGTCSYICDEGLTDCGDLCVNTDSHWAHCGSCNDPCGSPPNSTAICSDAACDFQCDVDYQRCGNECIEEGEFCSVCDPEQAPFGGGEGSDERPFLICTADQLAAISDELSADFLLTDDIDLGGEPFSPIGSLSNLFGGSFDGDGHQIENLTIEQSTQQGVGLFSSISSNATVSDLELINVDVEGASLVGAVVGFNQGTIANITIEGVIEGSSEIGGAVGVNELAGTIEGVSVDVEITVTDEVGRGIAGLNEGSISEGQTSGELICQGGKCGGLAGTNAGSIIDSTANTSVSGTASFVGGLVGRNQSTIELSVAHGAVTSEGDFVGGLVGLNTNSITESMATGTVTSEGDFTGGLVGSNENSIADSMATGNVDSDGDFTGGLVGHHEGSIDEAAAQGDVSSNGDYVGGLIGYAESGATIEKAAATGDVTANFSDFVGGLVGELLAELQNCYATGEVTGSSNVGGLVGLVTDSSSGDRPSVIHCHSIGKTSGNTNVGGLIGNWTNVMFPPQIEASFWDTETSEQPSSAEGEGYTTAEFSNINNFDPPWDFSDIWEMSDVLDDNTRPVLQWQDL